MITNKDLISFDEAFHAVVELRSVILERHINLVDLIDFETTEYGLSAFEFYAFLALLGAPKKRVSEYLDALRYDPRNTTFKIMSDGHAIGISSIEISEGRS